MTPRRRRRCASSPDGGPQLDNVEPRGREAMGSMGNPDSPPAHLSPTSCWTHGPARAEITKLLIVTTGESRRWHLSHLLWQMRKATEAGCRLVQGIPRSLN